MRRLVLLLAIVVGVLWAPTAASAGCHVNLGSVAVESNVSCHITQVVDEKVVPHIEAGQTDFRVYVRGFWHCETATIEGLHAMICTRRRGIISLVSE
jgi:hypothetical protein